MQLVLMNHKDKWWVLLVGLLVLCGVFIVGYKIGWKSGWVIGSLSQFEEEKETRKSQNIDCYSLEDEASDGYMKFEEVMSHASEKLSGNDAVMELLRERCEIVMNDWRFDVTGDGEGELLFTTSGYGCASCHGQTLYVFDGDRLLLERKGTDILLRKTKDGLEVIEPIKLSDEAYCCPTYGMVYGYRYDEDMKRLVGDSQDEIIKYSDIK